MSGSPTVTLQAQVPWIRHNGRRLAVGELFEVRDERAARPLLTRGDAVQPEAAPPSPPATDPVPADGTVSPEIAGDGTGAGLPEASPSADEYVAPAPAPVAATRKTRAKR